MVNNSLQQLIILPTNLQLVVRLAKNKVNIHKKFLDCKVITKTAIKTLLSTE